MMSYNPVWWINGEILEQDILFSITSPSGDHHILRIYIAFGFILAKLRWDLILFSLKILAWLLRNIAVAASGKWGICLPEKYKVLLLL